MKTGVNSPTYVNNIVIIDIKLLLKIYKFEIILPVLCFLFWGLAKYADINDAMVIEAIIAILFSSMFECMYSRDSNEYINYSIVQVDLKKLIIGKNISTTIVLLIIATILNLIIVIVDGMNAEYFNNSTAFILIILLYSLVYGNIISSRKDKLKNYSISLLNQVIYIVFLAIQIFIFQILRNNIGLLTSAVIILMIQGIIYILLFKKTMNSLEINFDCLLEE